MEPFEAVYEELFPQVYRYLLVLCGDRDVAEELTQETFFQAIQHIDSFRGDCKLYVWLCQIGKRQYLAGLRRRKRRGEMPDLERQPSPDQLEERLLDRELNGQSTVYLCYTQTIRSSLTPLFNSVGKPESRGHLSIGNGLLLDPVKGAAVQAPFPDQIQAVYYLAGDYAALEDMGEAEFSAATDGAVPLWQRS